MGAVARPIRHRGQTSTDERNERNAVSRTGYGGGSSSLGREGLNTRTAPSGSERGKGRISPLACAVRASASGLRCFRRGVIPTRLTEPRSKPRMAGMSGPPSNHDLARQLAVLEERMNTHQATYETGLERIERKMAERDAEFARRDKTNIQWMVGLWAAAVIVIIAVLGFMIRTGS